jgi:hypothetical protein
LQNISPIGGPPPSINPSGAIAGTYQDASGTHGFLRESNGTLTTVDFPGSVGGTEVLAINPAGTLVGAAGIGFLRAPHGTFITTNFPGIPVCINPAGTIAGTYVDFSHGFVRSPNGTVTAFEAPGSAPMEVIAINPTFPGFSEVTPTLWPTFLEREELC